MCAHVLESERILKVCSVKVFEPPKARCAVLVRDNACDQQAMTRGSSVFDRGKQVQRLRPVGKRLRIFPRAVVFHAPCCER